MRVHAGSFLGNRYRFLSVVVIIALAAALLPWFGLSTSAHAGLLDNASKAWTFTHASSHGGTTGFLSEIVAHDKLNGQLWVSGVTGVDILNASNGSLVGHIDISAFGSINSVAIHNGIAALALESSTRTAPGIVQLYDTTQRQLLSLSLIHI